MGQHSSAFEGGNGRVARLLTNAMLGVHGYTVGRYVSLEPAIAESADAYYQAPLIPPTAGTRAPPTHGPGSATSPV